MNTRSLFSKAAVLAAALALIAPSAADAQRAHGGAMVGFHVGGSPVRVGHGVTRPFNRRGYERRRHRYYPGYFGYYGDYGDYGDYADLSDGYAPTDAPEEGASNAYAPPPPTHPICPALIHWDTKTGRAIRTNYC
jgi:hypothetical protein